MADSGLENPNAPVSPPEPAKLEPLAQGVYALITGGDPNTGFIVGERGVVVIDARATPALASETTPRHLMVHIDGAIKLANPLVSGQADPYTE